MSNDTNVWETATDAGAETGVSTLSEPLVAPLAPSGDGRDPQTGRFLPGNHLGIGSPLAGKAAKLRAALFKAVGREDMQAIIRAMIERAKGGDVAATRVILAYTLGEPESLDLISTVARLEAVVLRGVA